MALYASSKHALEGYSESVDHELREHGVRVLLVEPGFTKTGFDTSLAAADQPLPLYTRRREIVDVGLADALKAGDEPSVVGRAIVAAATDKRPKLRYPAGSLARRVSKARRYVPAAIFDKQIRKINQLNRPASTTVSSPERKTSNGQPMSLQAPQAGSHRKQAGGEGL
jgi:short-subunit dehydrogenase